MLRIVEELQKLPVVRAVSAQSGFTLVEVMVASAMLLTGLVATLGILNSAGSSNNVTERRQVSIGIAQRALEKTASLSFEELALTATPEHSEDPNSPLNRVTGNQFLTELELNETMVIGDEDAAVNPGPETVNEGGVSAQVYRFVTWVDAPNYQGCTQNCKSTEDYKRITVAIQASSESTAGFSKYVLVSTVRIDPLLGPGGQVVQPPDPNPTQAADNFFLYDTINDNCSSTTYESPGDDHPTHDTTGSCASIDGTNPDLMGTEPPPNPSYPEDPPPPYTYSTDLDGDYTGGLAIQRNTDCVQEGLDKFQMHSWTTNPLSDSPYEMTGKLSFQFWTATIGSTGGAGKVCVWLYDRDIVEGEPQDTPIGTPPYIYSLDSWPAEATNLSFTVSHDPYTLPAGNRLRFVLVVSSLSDSDLQFIYDHPTSSSFVQLRTTTPIAQ